MLTRCARGLLVADARSLGLHPGARALGLHLGMADDTEKAILYAFDQSGAVPPDLRERAVAYLRELQARRGRVAVAPRRVTNPLPPATRFTADARSFAPFPPPPPPRSYRRRLPSHAAPRPHAFPSRRPRPTPGARAPGGTPPRATPRFGSGASRRSRISATRATPPSRTRTRRRSARRWRPGCTRRPRAGTRRCPRS